MLSEEENDRINAMDNAITGLIKAMANNEQIIDHNYKFLCDKFIELSENHSKILEYNEKIMKRFQTLIANPMETREAIARTAKEEREKNDRS